MLDKFWEVKAHKINTWVKFQLKKLRFANYSLELFNSTVIAVQATHVVFWFTPV